MDDHDDNNKNDPPRAILNRVLAKHLGNVPAAPLPYTGIPSGFTEWCSFAIRIKDKLNGSNVGPLSFERRAFLKPIYEDDCPDLVLMKAAQVGGSQLAICRALYWAAVLGHTVGYYAPTDELLRRIVQSRVYGAIELSPVIKAMLTPATNVTATGKRIIRNLSLIGLNEGVIHFLGAQSPTQLISLDCDSIVLDEFDLFSPAAVVAATDRLGGSPYQRRILLSTPSIPRFGIARAYDESDKRRYFHKCQHCGHWGPLVFPGSIKKIGKCWEFTCSKCGQAINRFAAGPGEAEWVAEFPSRSSHGYHIHGLLSPTRTAAEIHRRAVDAFKNGGAEEEGFFRNVLGEIKVANSDGLDPDDLLACVAVGENATGEGAAYRYLEENRRETVAGVDIGKRIHITIFEIPSRWYKHPRLIFAGSVGDGTARFDETRALDEIMKRFNVRIAVIDALPETRFVSDFLGKWRHKAYKCVLKPSLDRLFLKTDSATVEASRVLAFDELFARVRRREIYLPTDFNEVPDFVNHIINITRTVQESGNTIQSVNYDSFSRPDHFASAAMFGLLALELYNKYGKPVKTWDDILRDIELEVLGGSELCIEDEWETKKEQIREAQKRLDKFDDIFRNGHL